MTDVILIPKDNERNVIVLTEMFNANFNSYRDVIEYLSIANILKPIRLDIVVFFDDLTANKLELDNYWYIPVTIKSSIVKAIDIECLGQNEINDIFSYTDTETGEKEFCYFPRDMAMTLKDVESHLN